MQKQKDKGYNFQIQMQQIQNGVRSPKTAKAKFIRDLNYKSNTLNIRSSRTHLMTNSKQKQIIIKHQRSRQYNTKNSLQMQSLLERAIPGAKILKGDWKDHKLNGQVIIQYDNGSRFQGKYQNGVRTQGKMIYADSDCQYQGFFFGEKFSGFGKLSYNQGRSIQGEWDNMQFIGNATINYPNKDVYYGPVDQQLYKHGEGYLFLNSGYKYIGMFRHGSITGVGGYFKDQQLIVKGVWAKGKLIRQLTNEQAQVMDSNFNGELNFIKEDKRTTVIQKKSLKASSKQNSDYSSYESARTSSILSLKSQQKQLIRSNNYLEQNSQNCLKSGSLKFGSSKH